MIENYIFKNYKIAVEFSWLFNKNLKKLYVKNKFINFDFDQNIFQEEQNELNLLPEFPIASIIEKKPYIIRTFSELFKITKNYQYISLSKDLENLFKEDFGHIECDLYKNTQEGKNWEKIFKIFHELNLTQDLCSLEVFMEKKEFYNNIFPYSEITDLKKISLLDLYQKFFHKMPANIPNNIKIFDSAIFIKKTDGIKKMIDKNLVKFLNEPALLISSENEQTIEGFVDHIIFLPKFEHYSKWQLKESVEINPENLYEEKLFLENKINKIEALRLGLFTNEKNFYGEIKKYLMLEIKMKYYKKYENNESLDWKNSLKFSGNEYFKILQKYETIIKLFEQLVLDYDLTDLEFDFNFTKYKIGAYSKKTNIGIDFCWQNITMPRLYNKFPKIRYLKKDLTKYFIVAQKIQEIDLKEEYYPKIIKEKEILLEDDLFYWHFS